MRAQERAAPPGEQTVICRYERRRWPRLGVVGVGCGFDPRKPGFLSAARCRAPLVCPGVRRAHGASVHFHDREPQRRGPLRCPADLHDASVCHEWHSFTSTLESPGPGFQPNGPPSIPHLQHSARRFGCSGRARPSNFGGEVRRGTWCERARQTPAPLGPHRDGATMNHGTSQPVH